MKILLILLSLLSFSEAFALERFDIITTEKLKEKLERRNSGDEQFLLINTLDKLIANYHSIPGSINIPWSQVTESQNLLGKDKNIPIITYCMGYR